MTYMGKGGLPYNHPLCAGHAGIQVGGPMGNKTFLESDLVIGVGCRFTDRHTGKVDVYRWPAEVHPRRYFGFPDR